MTRLDLSVMALYGALLLWIGLRAGRGHQSAAGLTLGERRLPTWAVLCSMTATELSAATFIGVPHAAYTGDWSYLQLAFGALLGKAVLARWVIPLYHALGVVTVYGFLHQRFGPLASRAAALAFIGGRVLASGVRLFIAALALAAVTDIEIGLAVVCCGLVSGLYTLAGGIRAVVWTDTLQGAVFLLAALATLGALLGAGGGGLGGLLQWAGPDERTRIFHWAPLFSLGDPRAFGAALAGAFFLTLATHATDHDMVQRLLTTSSGRAGGRALLGSALLNFPLTAIFLLIGTGLARYYSVAPDYDIEDHARILPLFGLHELPGGLRGLLFAGLFAAAMSSLDSAICALATSWACDVLRPTDDARITVRRLRLGSVVFTLLLILSALAMARYHAALIEQAAAEASESAPSLVEFALSSMTILYGGLAGIFALGILTRRRGSPWSVLLGLVAGAALGLALFLHPLLAGRGYVAWCWWIPLSASLAFALGALGRRSGGAPPARE